MPEHADELGQHLTLVELADDIPDQPALDTFATTLDRPRPAVLLPG